jgi:hypothetical protein
MPLCLFVLLRQRLTEIGKGLALAIALHRAQTPRKRLKGASDQIGLLQFIHELVEDLARLGGSHTDQRRNVRARLHRQVRAVEDSDRGGGSKGTLCILARVDGKGDILVVLENIGQRRRRPVLLVVLRLGIRAGSIGAIASVVAITTVVTAAAIVADATAARLDRLERNGRLDLSVMSREIMNLRGKSGNGSLGNSQTVLEIGK